MKIPSKIFLMLVPVLLTGCSETSTAKKGDSNTDSAIPVRRDSSPVKIALPSKSPSTASGKAEDADRVNMDSLKTALKDVQKLSPSFTYKDIKLIVGNYDNVPEPEARLKLLQKLNPRIIPFPECMKRLGSCYFGEGGISLISGYFYSGENVVIVFSFVGSESDRTVQNYWLQTIAPGGKASELINIYCDRKVPSFYLMTFKMLNDTLIRVTEAYDGGSNLFPDTKTDTTFTKVMLFDLSKMPCDTMSVKTTFKTSRR